MISLRFSALKYSHRRKYRKSTTVVPEASPDLSHGFLSLQTGLIKKAKDKDILSLLTSPQRQHYNVVQHGQ